MRGKTVLVTGANTGIGLETAAALAGMGAEVVITARDPVKGSAAVAEIRRRHPEAKVDAMELDLSRLGDVRSFAKSFADRHDRLDVLVNNAGLMLGERSVTDDGYETTFQVNHLGPFLLTNLLLPLLKASAPEGTGVTANSLHPGTVRTGFGQDGDAKGFMKVGLALIRPFILSPAGGANTTIRIASSPDVEDRSGEYYARSRPSRATRAAQDDEAARRLWEVSSQLVGFDP